MIRIMLVGVSLCVLWGGADAVGLVDAVDLVDAVGLLGPAEGPPFVESRVDPVVDPSVHVALAAQSGDTVCVWVFFTDKGIETDEQYLAALTEVEAGYSERAKARRKLRRTAPGLFDYRDLPPAAGHIESVIATGAEMRTQSRWLNAVSVEASLEQIGAIASQPFVRWIKPLARAVPPEPWVEDAGPGGGAVFDFYGYASEQLHQINIPAVHDLGFTGEGIEIGILDTGFVRTHEAFNEPGHEVQILDEWDFINNDPNVGKEPGDPSGQHRHGTYILGTLGAYKPNTLVGGAYDAAFYLAKTEDVSREEPIEEDFYVAGLEWIEANGADMATSSLIYFDWYEQKDMNGRTAVTTKAVNIATGNGLACCTAVGNEGHDNNPNTSHLGAPADAFEVLSCGAVNKHGEIASFSGDGPTADGRVKPEVLALGVSAATVDPDRDTRYVHVSGTSLSTPLVACATALVIDARPDWSVRQIRSAFMQTADYYLEHGQSDPLFIYGYGVIDVLAAINMTFIGDIDRDGDTDLADYKLLHACLDGPNVAPSPECTAADLDEDEDVDLADVALFFENFTGLWER